MDFRDFLKILATKDGSDLYLSSYAPPCAKFQGILKPLEKQVMTQERIREIANSVMTKDQQAEFENRLEMNLAISEKGVGRFRVNIFQQRNDVAMVIRNIKTEIPNYKHLGLPDILTKVIMEKRGLILFVGGTGSGKSTSLAALIDYRNSNDKNGGHIITIEDPVEFVHRHKRCIINQREVGVDTLSFHDALKNTLRQAPDVILIGEIRDQETMEHALAFAETGHLAISTLHANNANQALDRIINFFPEERKNQLLNDLSLNLRAFVSQRLVHTIDKKRCAAIEILLGTPTVQELVKRGDVHEIKEIMEKSRNLGMQTFDRALYRLWEDKKISLDEALKNSDAPNNLRLMIKLAGNEIDGGDIEDESTESNANKLTLSLEGTEEEKDDPNSLAQYRLPED